jgi:hypothetical protein
MHFAFDLEFMIRLVLAGETPLLLQEDTLSVRVLHEGAKSADTSPWKGENRLIWRLHRHSLTRSERAFRYVGAAAVPVIAFFGALYRWLRAFALRALEMVRANLIHRPLRFAGDLLDHVPESVRPKIRNRDRHPDTRNGPPDP